MKMTPQSFTVTMEPQPSEPVGPVGVAMAPVREAVAEVRTHSNQLAATHGVAMVAVLGDLLTDIELRVMGAERRLAVELGSHRRTMDDQAEELDRYICDERATMAVLEDLLAEIERRNRRSHATQSQTARRARKLVDQYHLDQA